MSIGAEQAYVASNELMLLCMLNGVYSTSIFFDAMDDLILRPVVQLNSDIPEYFDWSTVEAQ